MKVSVIIAAAGSGTRMNHTEKKQFIELEGVPILIRTLQKFHRHQQVDEIVIVTNEADVDRVSELINSYHIQKVVAVVKGGKRRQDSVLNALQVITGEVVMVHDAARPFVTEDIITENLLEIKTCDGLITCVPSKDTIKVVDKGVVVKTLERASLVNVQTPQTFNVVKLRAAYAYMLEHALEVTDDAALAEVMGYHVKTVMGSYDNIKITTPEDLLVGGLILKRG